MSQGTAALTAALLGALALTTWAACRAPERAPAPHAGGGERAAPVVPPRPVEGSRTPATLRSEPSTAELTALVRGSNTFGLELYAQLRPQPGNLVFSPASIATALLMTTRGARGMTRAELDHVLHLEGDLEARHRAGGALVRSWNAAAREGFQLRVANRLYGQQGHPFVFEFLSFTRDVYEAPLEPVDFRFNHELVRRQINQWVAERTQDRILELFPEQSITPTFRLALVNAMYLNADWQHPFSVQDTQPMPFTTASGQRVEVPTMNELSAYAYAHRDGVRVLTLAYREPRYAMSFLLPDATDGLAALEASLDAMRLATLLGATEPRSVQVSLPRFRVAPPASIDLRQHLQTLGMNEAFSERSADFSGIAPFTRDEDRLYFGSVMHKAFVEVNERGTEAVAATGVGMVVLESGAVPIPNPERFNADHPFLFVLHDTQTGAMLFLGRVHDPR